MKISFEESLIWYLESEIAKNKEEIENLTLEIQDLEQTKLGRRTDDKFVKHSETHCANSCCHTIETPTIYRENLIRSNSETPEKYHSVNIPHIDALPVRSSLNNKPVRFNDHTDQGDKYSYSEGMYDLLNLIMYRKSHQFIY